MLYVPATINEGIQDKRQKPGTAKPGRQIVMPTHLP